jgi:hypothetical protein
MPHTELARNGGGCGMVRGVDSALGGVAMEAEGSCKGGEGSECPHGRRRGSLKEHVIRGQQLGQAHCGNILQRPL